MILLFLIFKCLRGQSSQTPFYEAFSTTPFDYSDWNIISNGNSYQSNCNGIEIFGGYQKFDQNSAITKLISLPPHSLLRVSLYFWKIDSQNSSNLINFYVDDQIFFTDIFSLSNGINRCGSTYSYEVITINQEIKHNFPTALIVISFQRDPIQMQEFWGINKFQLFITKCPIGCVFCEDQAILPQQCNQFILASSSLTAITQEDFNIEGWQITNQQKDKSLCGDIPILCKYENSNYCIQKTKIDFQLNLPKHTHVIIHFRFFKIDSWDGELFKFFVDQLQKLSIQYSAYEGYCNICGLGYPDFSEYFQISFEHNNQDLILQFETTLSGSSDDESFGVRDVQIFIKNQCEYQYYQECCGDGIKQKSEDCDDKNMIPFDGCFNCQYSCVEGCSLCVLGICYDCSEYLIYHENTKMCLQMAHDSSQPSQTCNSFCLICKFNQCFQCKDNYILNSFTHRCEQIQEQETQNCAQNHGIISLNENFNIDYQLIFGCNFPLSEETQKPQCDKECSFCYQQICRKCNKGYTLHNNECITICGDGFVNINKEECDNLNNEGCIDCQIQPKYACVQEDYSICWTCDQKCIDCVFITELQCHKCLDGYFPIGYNCQPCDTRCITCEFESNYCTSCYRDDCLLCENFYGLYTDQQLKKCISKCGDGIVMEEEECDDGNSINGDGCNADCHFEYFIEDYDTELNVQRIQGSNDFNISKSSNINFNCSDIYITIENFEKEQFTFNLTQSSIHCIISFKFLKTIYPYNLISISIPFNLYLQRFLLEINNTQNIIIIPEKQIFLTEIQQEQAKLIASAQQYFYLILWITGPLSILFGVFDYFWAVLEILSWINNFYFLNVSFPFNVQTIFINSDWSQLISFPTFQQLNQPDSEYFFTSPQKFMDKGVDPLFINNAQVPIGFILLSIILYIFSLIVFLIIKLLDRFLKKVSVVTLKKPLRIFQIRRTIQNTQTCNNQEIEIKKKIIHNEKVIHLLRLIEKTKMILYSRIKQTVSLCILDITMAVTLQILMAKQFEFFIIQINQGLAFVSILVIIYQLYQSYLLIKMHPILEECQQFKYQYGCFYEGINVKNQFGLWYNFIYLIRKVFYIFFTVQCYYNPLIQTSLCFVTCILGVLLIFYQNPFETKRILRSVLVLFDDQTGMVGEEGKIIQGWILISFMLLALLTEIFTLIYEILIKICQQLYQIYKYIMNDSNFQENKIQKSSEIKTKEKSKINYIDKNYKQSIRKCQELQNAQVKMKIIVIDGKIHNIPAK